MDLVSVLVNYNNPVIQKHKKKLQKQLHYNFTLNVIFNFI